MDHDEEATPQDGGPGATRRRGAALEAAILEATWDELMEGGYAQLSMEKVAARARTGKQVLYRRWPNRALLFVAAMRHRLGPTVPEVPDTGDLREDVLTILRMFQRRWSGMRPDVMHGMLAEVPDLGPEFFTIMDGVMTTVLRQAESRGELVVDALPPRVIALPIDLFRYEAMRPRAKQADPEAAIREIVDDVFLPLVRAHSGGK